MTWALHDDMHPAAAQRSPFLDECRAMSRDGYLVMPGFFGAGQVAAFDRWMNELQTAPEEPGRHWVYREASLTDPAAQVIQRIENFCPFHANFDRAIRGGALLRWVAGLMGADVVLFKDKINFKMPGAPGFKAHQDQQAGWGRYAPVFVTAMVTIDAATVENGCLELVAGRHKEGLIGKEWEPLDEAALDLVPSPTEPGDVIFFDSYAPHASKPNFTDSPRRILYLTYNLAQHGDLRGTYFADKRASFPPDVERETGRSYVFLV
jgi:hypothetical protein